MLEQNDLVFENSEIDSQGESLVQDLTNILWYIDGYHERLMERGCRIPPLFAEFVGYNVPQLLKHRKRQIGNLSSEVLQQHSRQLFLNLQSQFWQHPTWQMFHIDVEPLGRVLRDYVNYLLHKYKQMKLHHNFSEPIRNVGDNLTFVVLPVSTVLLHSFKNIGDALKAKQNYELTALLDLIPDEPSKRYRFILKKMSGLPFSAVLLAYYHGNNFGNLHFMWKVDGSSENVISQSQAEIESIQTLLSVFKTTIFNGQTFCIQLHVQRTH